MRAGAKGTASRIVAIALAAPLLAAAAWSARAQDAAADDAAAGDPSLTELEAVEVVAPRLPDADPFGFRAPPPPTRFERHWREPFNLHDIGMRGGLVQLGIGYALGAAAKGVSRVPGWKAQVQPAIARPPPLDEEQAARAAAMPPAP